jgi:lipopolysaccharide biosynthesis glycosyltransferase
MIASAPELASGRLAACPVAIALDEAYKPGLEALIRSLTRHTVPESLDVRVVIDAAAPSRFRRDVERILARHLTRYAVHPATDKRLDRPMLRRHVSAASYLRLILPQVIHDVDRVLYLDADVLALCDVSTLLTQPLGGRLLGAAWDPINPLLGSPLAITDARLPPDLAGRRYFNAGVMLIDMALWRQHSIGDRALELIASRDPRLNFVDQDALNLVVAGDFRVLDPRWNCYPWTEFSAEITRYLGDDIIPWARRFELELQARILHFIGPEKPWMPSYPGGRNRSLYASYRAHDPEHG